MKRFKGFIKYLFLFLFFFLQLHFIFQFFSSNDQVANLGFSYAISIGEVPYLDFNMIVPPFSAYLYSIPLFIKISYLFFNAFQALLLCILCYYLFKLYNKKAYILIACLSLFFPIPFVTILFQGYNFILLLLLVVLLYLEKEHKNDYLIGLILGISFFTKQTVGLCFCLPTIYYLISKDWKKVIRRISSFAVVFFVFLLYFLVCKNLYAFIDQCFLGMFDFSNKNIREFDYNLILFIFGTCFVLYKIFKNKKDITNYYILAFSSIAVPLFDYYHTTLYLYGILFLIVSDIKENKEIPKCSMIVFVVMSLAWFLFEYNFTIPNISSFNHYEHVIMTKERENNIMIMNKYFDDNKDKNIILLTDKAQFYKIINDKNITYYDLLNYGNHGYNGTNKLIDKLKKEHGSYVFVSKKEYNSKRHHQQINKEVMKFVMDNYEIIDRVGAYDIYYIK